MRAASQWVWRIVIQVLAVIGKVLVEYVKNRKK